MRTYGSSGLAHSSTYGSPEAFTARGINLLPDPEAARRAVAIAEVGDTLLEVIKHSPMQFAYLDSGYIGVRLTDLVKPGSKIGYRTTLGLAGTRYLPGSIAGFQWRTLGTTAARGLGISMAGAILTNLLDFDVGSQRQFGVGSPEFYSSTLVDFGVAGLSGLAAAGAVAGGIAIATALGIGVVATAPIWVTLVAAAGLGAGLVTVANSVTIGGQPALELLKARVVDGFYAWGGTLDNAQVIGDVVSDRIAQTAKQVTQTVNNAATKAVETVEFTARNVVTGGQTAARDAASWARNTVAEVKSTVQSAAKEAGQAISGAAQQVSNFIGSIFGGD